MAEDTEYDEVDAVVRIPKGERLADSRRSEGWSRGFTPKTPDKGPEHVEIRLKAEGEARSADEPEIVYVTEYVEDRERLTPAQQAAADIASQIIDGLFEIAKPLVSHWWQTQALPSLVAKRDAFVLKQHARKAQKKSLRASEPTRSSVAVPAPESESPAQDVATGEPQITVTSEQFQQMFMIWLAREDAQQSLWNVIVNAEVDNAPAATLAWQQGLKGLSPDQRTERVMELFADNPSILEDFARQLLGGLALGLGEANVRRDRV